MGRTKKVSDWSFTWSPEENVEELDEKIRLFFESQGVSRAYVVTERHGAGKFHLHGMFSTTKNYGSDNKKWWQKGLGSLGFKEPALCIK